MRTRFARLRPVHPGYVVFGIDHRDHTRAAWFSPREEHLARMASNMAGFHLLEPSRQAPAWLEEWLPRGTRLESGRFVVPRVRRGVFQKLVDLDDIAAGAHPILSCDEEPDTLEFQAAEAAADEADLLQVLEEVMSEYNRDKPDQN